MIREFHEDCNRINYILIIYTNKNLIKMQSIIAIEEHIDPDYKEEVRDAATHKKPKLDWIGGLKEYRNQYTSYELQEKALEWRE